MSALVSRKVAELSEASRRGIEQLIGSPLEANQRVYVVVDAPPPGPAPAAKIRAAEHIRQIVAQAQAHADSKNLTDEEMDAAVEEAMANVRHRA
jgi:hypothetical protein